MAKNITITLKCSKDEYDKIRKNECIRCACCQELCPHNAVKLKKPILYRVICALNYNGKKRSKRNEKEQKND